MKTRLLILICIAGFITSQSLAQITIDSTDMATAGDTILLANDTIAPSGIVVGDTGLQSWDFTSLQIDYLDTLRFRGIDTSTDDSLFPGSNLVMETPYQDSYIDFNASSLNIIGYSGDPFNVGIDFPLNFNPSQKSMEFPSTYGSTFIDTTKFVISMLGSNLDPQLPAFGLDTVRINHYGEITSQIDAYGTVQLPTGTFNTIRQLYIESTIDEIWIYCKNAGGCTLIPDSGWSLVPGALLSLAGLPPVNPIIDTTYTYRWLAKNNDFPILEIETDTIGGNALVGRFKIDTAVVGVITASTSVTCMDTCNGSATATGISGVMPYNYLWDDPAAQTTATATGLCGGVISVLVIDAIQDTSVASVVMISEPAALTVTITSTPNPGTGNDTLTVVASGGTLPYSYLWDDPAAQTTASATGLTFGIYTVIVTDNNGCKTTITGTTVGLQELMDSEHILVYPNPAANELILKSDDVNASFIAYNLIGKQVLNIKVQLEINVINISELATGMYIFQIVDSEGRVLQVGKFSIER